MIRSSAILVVLCLSACSEPETPLILEGERGGCDSVVRGATPDQVECPSACPIAVQAFRVVNGASCQRASAPYVACISAGGNGTPGSALLDTEDGPIFVDDPAYDCNRDDGCAGVSTTTTGRWITCAEADEPACNCVCQGGECAYDRFVDDLNGCGLATPCGPLDGEEAPTEEVLQCYMDELAKSGPNIKIEFDLEGTNQEGEDTTGRIVLGVGGRTVVRLQELSVDAPASVCDLQEANFFLTCNPEEPTVLNVENEEGLIERLPCTDPRAWVINCSSGEPVCPS